MFWLEVVARETLFLEVEESGPPLREVERRELGELPASGGEAERLAVRDIGDLVGGQDGGALCGPARCVALVDLIAARSGEDRAVPITGERFECSERVLVGDATEDELLGEQRQKPVGRRAPAFSGL